MTQSLVPQSTSPFDTIRQWEDGHEYWSARDLDYVELPLIALKMAEELSVKST